MERNTIREQPMTIAQTVIEGRDALKAQFDNSSEPADNDELQRGDGDTTESLEERLTEDAERAIPGAVEEIQVSDDIYERRAFNIIDHIAVTTSQMQSYGDGGIDIDRRRLEADEDLDESPGIEALLETVDDLT